MSALIAICFLTVISRVSATLGTCYLANSDGRCSQATRREVTWEQCCHPGASPATAWAAGSLTPAESALRRTVTCLRCHSSCERVRCSQGEECVMNDGYPQCVCNCSGLVEDGQVCGLDGRTYDSRCHFKRANCHNRQAIIDYKGPCRASCATTQCAAGEFCITDQNGAPHCVTCSRSCARATNAHVCGTNGHTHNSVCRHDAFNCRHGGQIAVAYQGHCRAEATCATVQCSSSDLTCVTDPVTNAPRCIDCSPCSEALANNNRVICGSNSITYASWCEMRRVACESKQYLTTLHAGLCIVRLQDQSEED